MKIDLFNKKKIEFLENEIEKLWYNLVQKEKTIKELQERPRCFELNKGDFLDDKYVLARTVMHVKAIEDYLKLDVKREYIDDPQSLPREIPKILSYKAYKLK